MNLRAEEELAESEGKRDKLSAEREDLTEAIQALPGTVAVPIVAMTANAFDEDRERCLAAGMNDFLVKPVAPEVLFERVLEWLGKVSPK